MNHAYNEGHSAWQPAADWTLLKSRGWLSFELPFSSEVDLRKRMLVLANGLGTLVVTRAGGSLCDKLVPTEANAAKPRSLSKIYAVGQFPLHIDTAHWLRPCRYVMLACIVPGEAGRPTLLMDTRKVPLRSKQAELLYSTPLRVMNGRNSFFSTILSNSRPFIRFDPGCMIPTSPSGVKALAVWARENWPDYIETIYWTSGMVIVLDNWRILHGRDQAKCPDSGRKLFRISIK